MSLFINGKWIEGEGQELVSINPATSQVLWRHCQASQRQVAQAVHSAKEAWLEWSLLDVAQRIEYCRNFVACLKNEDLATLIAQETGKPLWESKTEVSAVLGKLDISIQAYQERTGSREASLPVGKSVLRHRPHGVLAVFGPYNFPAHLPNGHIMPALIAGNTVVFKPSELTPQVAQAMTQAWEKSGIPQGVINLVQGAKEVGVALATNPDIDGVLFTGSHQTGLALMQSVRPEKMLALEMGGNNPLVVYEAQNIDAVVYEVIQSAFITSGQRCVCARRLFLQQGSTGDAILQKLIKVSSSLQIGHYAQQPEPFMGPVISEDAAQLLVHAQQNFLAQGAEPLLQMKHIEHAFVSPAILDVSQVLQPTDDEHFGPLLQVIRYQDFDEAIEQANATQYGLSAGLLSDSQVAFDYFLPRIRAGIVNWNRQITGASSAAPFGGIGASGNFRPSAYYAADYCSFPVASIECQALQMPKTLSPGLSF